MEFTRKLILIDIFSNVFGILENYSFLETFFAQKFECRIKFDSKTCHKRHMPSRTGRTWPRIICIQLAGSCMFRAKPELNNELKRWISGCLESNKGIHVAIENA